MRIKHLEKSSSGLISCDSSKLTVQFFQQLMHNDLTGINPLVHAVFIKCIE